MKLSNHGVLELDQVDYVNLTNRMLQENMTLEQAFLAETCEQNIDWRLITGTQVTNVIDIPMDLYCQLAYMLEQTFWNANN